MSRLKSNKIGTTYAITKSSRNKVYRTKQRRNKGPSNIFRGFQVSKMVRLIFLTTKENMKGKCYIFSCYKERNKVRFVSLERKLQQDRYGWCFFKLKSQKTLERKFLQTSKKINKAKFTHLAAINKEIRCAWCIWKLNWNQIRMVDAFSS